MNEILISIREFSAIQSELISSLDRIHPFLDSGGLDDLPKAGSFDVLGAEWNFKRHGAGIKFVNVNGVVVDAHCAVEILNGVDAWRLALYLSSIQGCDVSHRKLEASLSELLMSGDIKASVKNSQVYEVA